MEEIRVPRGVLLAAGLLMAFVISVVALHRRRAEAPLPPPTAERALTVTELPDGGLEVADATGSKLARLRIVGDSFAMTALRGVAGRVGQIAGAPPFTLDLAREPSGLLVLSDPKTGRRLPVTGFGADNRAALARFLD